MLEIAFAASIRLIDAGRHRFGGAAFRSSNVTGASLCDVEPMR